MRIETQKAGKNDINAQGTSTNEIRAVCPIPAGQKVFPGLQVSMDIVAGSVKGVLTLPVSAVEGRFDSGFVYVPDADGGQATKKPVKLGMTDGKIIEILEGLSEADEVLEFVPNTAQDEMENGVAMTEEY